MSSTSSLILLISLSALLAVGLGEKVAFTDCGSEEGVITSIDVSNCASMPCKFKKGTNVSVEIEFHTKKDMVAATSKVHGIIWGFAAPFPLPDSDSCHFMNCPQKAGTVATYRHSIYVQPMYPSINVKVQWKLVSPTGTVVCFTIPASVES